MLPGMRDEPKRLMQAPTLEVLTDPETVKRAVRRHYQELGYLLDEEEDASAVLADATCHDCPIVGVTRGFLRVTGFPREHLLGKNCRIMLNGVPEVAVSKSARKNLRDFCRMCRFVGMSQISEVTSMQPNARQDGSKFMNFFMVGLCLVDQHPFILGVSLVVGEGLLVRLPSNQIQTITEESRATLLKMRSLLCAGRQAPQLRPRLSPGSNWPDFAFYGERLQDHCTLFNCNLTAVRREPHELATNCLVYGDAPVPWRERGLFFAVTVEDIVSNFNGLPIMGFTRRKPEDVADLYPPVAKCMGASVLVGACGEAFARDQHSHFCIGFKPPPQSEVAVWTLQEGVPNHRRAPPLSVKPGDELGCLYTPAGHLQLWRNGRKFMDFDVGRPPEAGTDYYAVVDTCFAVYSLTLVPRTPPTEAEPMADADAAAGTEIQHHVHYHPVNADEAEAQWVRKNGRRKTSPADLQRLTPSHPDKCSCKLHSCSTCSERDHPSDHLPCSFARCVDHQSALEAIREAVNECGFCVTVADPKGETPLIAVSEAFEELTGYRRQEILGKNCRFLNEGCQVSHQDIVGLRVSANTGAPFVALLLNRKKSGELFVNLLDLQGLAVARNPDTGEVLWFCVGIQADVSGISDDAVPQRHTPQRQEVARKILRHLRQGTAVSWRATRRGAPCQYCLLEEPVWMNGGGCFEYSSGTSSHSYMGLQPTMPPGTAIPRRQHLSDEVRSLLGGSTSEDAGDFVRHQVTVRSFSKAYDAKAACDGKLQRRRRAHSGSGVLSTSLGGAWSWTDIKGWFALSLSAVGVAYLLTLGATRRR